MDLTALFWVHPRIVGILPDEIRVIISVEENAKFHFGDIWRHGDFNARFIAKKANEPDSYGYWRIPRVLLTAVHGFLCENLPRELLPRPILPAPPQPTNEIKFGCCFH